MVIQDTTVLGGRQAAIDWLRARINYERTLATSYDERQFPLDRMRTLLTRLGQPDAGLKIIHVAGTKGKGSTSAMIAGVLTAAGYRTGVFSSPHLERIEERFAVDGAPCTETELVALVDRLRPVVAAMDAEAAAAGDPQGGPTYFEATTAIALLHFVERTVDAAVLEVGLGGRLDSTNVCLPTVSVITSISLDHTQQLGNTLAAIAGEKAGIIKPGVPVVCGVTEEEPQDVIARTTDEHDCRLLQTGRDFRYRYRDGRIDFEYAVAGQEHCLENVPLAMRGPHQAANAAVALATIAELRHQGWCVPIDAMRRGLARATLPGRVELIAGEPNVVLDTAHNLASARALVDALAEMASVGRRTLILAVSHDKDVRAIVRELAPHFDRVMVTQYQENPRAVQAIDLAELVRAESGDTTGRQVTVCATPREAWNTVRRSAEPGELVCIAGSFYLAAELRELVLASSNFATAPAPG
ncbi:MAG: folylpolyglutamate synthase/dihydrofolate synthase family protein [Pirellulales bacterium]